jgi:hypothetical protein
LNFCEETSSSAAYLGQRIISAAISDLIRTSQAAVSSSITAGSKYQPEGNPGLRNGPSIV